MAFSKAIRQAVYDKYNGRCAYCGREIAYKDMQVDHFVAKRGWDGSGSDDISNLMPSCRMCNHYKRANSLETFRHYIEEIPRKLRENYIYKVGVVYGNVLERKKPIIFFFEQEGNETKSKTNADRIRAMSDEKLALFVRAVISAESCPYIDCDCDECFFKEPCSNGLKWYGKEIEWLQQPFEGE